MKVNKTTLENIRNLIEDSMDSEKTPSFDESMDCLYKAINELNKLIESETMIDNEKFTFSKYKFTKRQCEILTLIAQGYSYSEIKDKLKISLSTIKSHLNIIYAKLGLSSKEDTKSTSIHNTKAALIYLQTIGALDSNWNIKI